MTQQPQQLDYQSITGIDRQQKQLRGLAVCWVIWSVLLTLGGCVGMLFTLFGTSLRQSGLGAMPPGTPLQVFITFATGFTMFVAPFWGAAVLGFLTAYLLPRRRGFKTCYWAAGWSCVLVPIGTMVGVWTFVVLARREGKGPLRR